MKYIIPFACDTAHGPDHSAVSVFQQQDDGSLRMVHNEAQVTELRPPPEHHEHGQHWVRAPDGEEWVLTWHLEDQWSGHPLPCPTMPDDAFEQGYRYLGPAEWREDNGRGRYPTAQSPEMSVLGLRAVTAEARVAELEAELAREKDANEQRRLRKMRWCDHCSAWIEPAGFHAADCPTIGCFNQPAGCLDGPLDPKYATPIPLPAELAPRGDDPVVVEAIQAVQRYIQETHDRGFGERQEPAVVAPPPEPPTHATPLPKQAMR